MTIRSFLLAAALLLASAGAAYAQVPDAQTGTASPGRMEEHLRDRPFLPRVTPRIQTKEADIQRAPEGAQDVSFQLDRLVLEGVTVYDESELAAIYDEKLGTQITLADLYGIAADLTRKYRNDGYILTQIVVPPQTIEGGTARLQVIEGYIDGIHIESTEEESSLGLIRTIVSRIQSDQQGRALNVHELERSLLLVNDLPGVEARGVLSPSATKTGAADLTVIIERKPFDAMIGIDNFGSRFLGPVQLTAAGTLNSAFGMNEAITGQVVVAPDWGWDDELAYFGLSYEQPIFRNGTTFGLSGSKTFTDPGHTLSQFDVKGQSTYFALRLDHPFIRTRAMNLSGRAIFDYRNVESSNNVAPTLEDNIRAVRLGGRFEFVDSLLGAAYNIFDLEFAHGVDLFGATDEGDSNISRALADPTFFKMEAEIQRLQRLMPKVNLLMALSGQHASDALLSSEEFGVGGIGFGRGFDPSEVLGDSGVAGKLEVQWKEPVEIAFLEDYQAFGFFDAGRVWNTDPASNDQKSDTLTSAGLGFRADFNEMTTGSALVAFPLNRDVATMGDDDPRFFFSLNRRF